MKDLALFEVNMNRVAPATGVVLDCPDFHIPDVRGGGQPTRVHIEGSVDVLDGPGLVVRTGRASELKLSAAGALEFLIGEDRLLQHHQPAGLVVLGVQGEIHLAWFHGIHAEFHKASHSGVAAFIAVCFAVPVHVHRDALVGLGEDLLQLDRILWPAAAFVLQEVHHVELGALRELAEVDDDVKALGNCLHRKLARVQTSRTIHMDRVGHDVAVVGDQVEGHPVVGDSRTGRAWHLASGSLHLLHEGELEVACHRAVQQAEAVLARAHIHVRVVAPVGQDKVAQEAVVLEGVVPQLAIIVPGLTGDQQIHIIIPVAPVQAAATGKAQVDPIVQGLVASVKGRVVVHHCRVALVDVLGGEIEHVVVEPVGAHGLAEVAGDIDDATVAVRAARAGIRSVRVDRVVPRQQHRPAIVIELTREEEGVGVPIALSRVVPVVFVGRNCVRTKAPVGGDVDGQGVVVPHHQ